MIFKRIGERGRKGQNGSIPSLLAGLLILGLNLSCKNENVVNPEALKPRLLHDEQEMQAYLDAFPTEEYRIYKIPQAGLFYLDDREDAIKDILRKGGIWEENVVSLLKRYAKPATTVIDAGAYIGTHTVFMAKYVGEKGRVYAFEPQRKIYRELVHNLRLNKIRNAVPLRFALGSRSEIIEMSPPKEGNEGGTRIGHGGDKAELRTIDSFGFANVSLIKIDVEGFEKEVIEGAVATIQEQHPVLIVEIEGGVDYGQALPKAKTRIDSLKGRIVELGYSIRQMDPHSYLAKPISPSL